MTQFLNNGVDDDLDEVRVTVCERGMARQAVRALLTVATVLFAVLLCAALCGCVYKGGKIVDGTNLAIGMKIPGTEWNVSLLDYVGGVRVAGQDSTHITVRHEVSETNSYFGVVETRRASRLTADIEPLQDGAACPVAGAQEAVDDAAK